jgi:hypothetical protein
MVDMLTAVSNERVPVARMFKICTLSKENRNKLTQRKASS